jgi:hypothetical protein
MRVKAESVSNEIDESELHSEKQLEPIIWTWRTIIIDVIGLLRYAGQGKKTDEGTMMPPPNSIPNPTS